MKIYFTNKHFTIVMKTYFTTNVIPELKNYLNNKNNLNNKKYFSNYVLNELKSTKIICSNSLHRFYNEKIRFIMSNQLNTCDFDYFYNYNNGFIIEKYKYNYRELYTFYYPKNKKYFVTLKTKTCSCKSFKYSSKYIKNFQCKHLKPIIEKLEYMYTKINFILLLKQYTSINEAKDICYCCF